MGDNSTGNADKNPLAPGSAYLEYCVRQGWLIKKGEGQAATYETTPEGEKKLANVSINFDLSAMESIKKEPRRKYKRRK
jgi:predicted transcriptional regulator